MDIDDRMKAYEKTYQTDIPIRMPVVIRLDGKCFHSLTKKCERPFDAKLWTSIITGTTALLDEVPARFAYTQSDEVSLLLIDYNKFNSQQWFGGNVQKMVSVSAAILSTNFSKVWGSPGYFDSRVFAIPERDIENYFIWREQDAMRNAVSMAARAAFSHNQVGDSNNIEKLKMLKDSGIDFDQYPATFRFGTVISRVPHDYEGGTTNGYRVEAAPVFNHDYLKQFLTVEQE